MDMDTLRAFGEAAVSIFAIVNPVGGLPVFISLTADVSDSDRRKLLRLAGVAALAIILVMALSGHFLLTTVFQISIDELTFGGGLMLVVIGIRYIVQGTQQRQRTASQDVKAVDQIGLAISPIASPLLVGPGTIVNVMLIVSRHGPLFAVIACLAAFVFVILILNYANVLYRLMGPLVSLAVGRVMEIFIVAIGVKFCFSAIQHVFPALTK
ncbi:MAG: MarC family protein [Planctomycetaceae bacterium]|nr:MarC family protein [Planctomycetaceae bacterium]